MKKHLLLFSLFLFVLVGIGTFIFATYRNSHAVVMNQIAPEGVPHDSHLYDPAFINQAYEKGASLVVTPHEKIIGGIIPHHLLAAPLIAAFFEGLKQQQISTVILLSPNHYGIGKHHIITSQGYWTTVFGNLETNKEKVVSLQKSHSAFVEEDVFTTEHGIYGITPFIKKTFPQASLVPIVLMSSTTKAECDQLVKSLLQITDEHTIVVVSSDFSHYLPSDQADYYDKESLSVLSAFDADKAFMLDHTKNSDSPESLYTLLSFVKQKQALTFTLLQNTNSAKLTDSPSIPSTTSYVTAYFSKDQNVSLQSMFSYQTNATLARKTNTVTLFATGDVMTGRSVNVKLQSLQDFNYPFESVSTLLHQADAVFINLENPLQKECPLTTDGMIFCADGRTADALVKNNMSIVNIANNHIGNQGDNGVVYTKKILTEKNIAVVGGEKAALQTIKGTRFGFLGYNTIGGRVQGTSYADPVQMKKDIQELKKKVDVVIVQFHWGVEYTSVPTSQQISLGHQAIDDGADLVIGNHPHWVQGVEIYKGKVIAYSHGNFVFDQNWSRETQEGVIGEYTFSKNQLVNVSFLPIIISNNYQPRLATASEAEPILQRMESASENIEELVRNGAGSY